MIRTFEATTADELWLQLASEFRRGEHTEVQDSRLGLVHEILHVALTITEPRERWIVSREPAISPAFSIAEIVWIINGRNDASFLNYFNRALPKFAGRDPCYHGAYGHRLRNHFGVDQLDRVYHALRNDPDTRQAVLQIWDSEADLPATDGRPASEDIPCNVVALLKIRNGRLHWTQVMRSNDLFLGTPYNIVQFTTLQEILAGWLGVEIGAYDVLVDSLHVYEDSLNQVLTHSRTDSEHAADSLALPKEQSEAAFAELAARTEDILLEENEAEHLLTLVSRSTLPEAFRNMLSVMCAEGARRREAHDVADEIMQICTNRVYRQLVAKWFDRVGRESSQERTLVT